MFQERGRGTGRNRRTEITFGRVEICCGNLSGQAEVCQEKGMKVFKSLSREWQETGGGEEGQKLVVVKIGNESGLRFFLYQDVSQN